MWFWAVWVGLEVLWGSVLALVFGLWFLGGFRFFGALGSLGFGFGGVGVALGWDGLGFGGFSWALNSLLGWDGWRWAQATAA